MPAIRPARRSAARPRRRIADRRAAAIRGRSPVRRSIPPSSRSGPTCGRTSGGSGCGGSSAGRGSVAGAVAAAEVGLFAFARLVPIEILPTSRSRSRSSAWSSCWDSPAAARPRIGETALAVDAEGHLGDRVASALALAAAFPAYAGPVGVATSTTTRPVDDADGGRAVRPPPARPTPRRRFGSHPRTCSARASRSGRPGSCSRPVSCSLPLDAAAEPAGRRPSPRTRRSARKRAAGGSDRRDREGPRVRRGRTPRTRGRGSPRSCASWPASSGRTRTTSRRISPACRASSPTSARSSTRRTSSGPRRCRR